MTDNLTIPGQNLTITPLDLAQRLAKGWPCATCWGERFVGSDGNYDRCPDCNGTGVERYPQDEGFPHWYYDRDGELCVGTKLSGYIAAPYLGAAILWVLGSAAWRAKFGDDCALVLRSTWCYILGQTVWTPKMVGHRTPADLLRAMLDAIALKEATDA